MRPAIVLAALACLVSSSGDAAGRADDTGRFIVARVVVNPLLDARQREYVDDDPRLIGRLVEIAAGQLKFDGTSPCTRVQRTRARGTLADLLRANLAPGAAARQRPLRLAERGLGAAAGAVPIIRYRCLVPDAGARGGAPGGAWTEAASFPLGGRRRGLFWKTEALLVLAPAASVAARPAFDCRKARGPSDMAICRDPSLASWDRSVAAAYALLRDGGGPGDVAPAEDRGALVDSQRRFLAERARCGADRSCLEDRMAQRVEALMRRQYATGAP